MFDVGAVEAWPGQVRWDVFDQHLKLIEIPSDPFLYSDALELGIETFSDSLRSAKIAGHVRRSHEALQNVFDLSDVIA